MAEWKKVKLGDVVQLIGGGTPKTSVSEYWNGNIPWLSVKDFNNELRYVYSTEKTITELGLNNSSTKLLEKNDIIISARGTVGQLAMIPFPMAFNQSCYGIRAKNTIDSDFLYYLLKANIFILKKNTHGSVFDTITTETLLNLSICLPPLPTQKKIAEVLSCLDAQIELNRRINENLEQQAGAIFKEWFVDNAKPEWKVGKLGDLCNFQEGYVNPAQTNPEYFDGEVKWLRAVDINESFIINTSRTLTKKGFESAKSSALLFKPNTIAISKSGTIGRLGIISDYMCGNRAVINIAPKIENNLPFIHQFLKTKQDQFQDLAVGSVQKNLYVSILETLDITIPNEELLAKYNGVSLILYNKMKNNCVENETLAQIRDTLLPKLMNGELKV